VLARAGCLILLLLLPLLLLLLLAHVGVAGWVLFAFCTIFCCPLLMPIDGTAGGLVSHMGSLVSCDGVGHSSQ
jgi:hypothetical protein